MVGGSKLVGVTARFSFFRFFWGNAKNGLYFYIVSGMALFLFLNYILR